MDIQSNTEISTQSTPQLEDAAREKAFKEQVDLIQNAYLDKANLSEEEKKKLKELPSDKSKTILDAREAGSLPDSSSLETIEEELGDTSHPAHKKSKNHRIGQVTKENHQLKKLLAEATFEKENLRLENLEKEALLAEERSVKLQLAKEQIRDSILYAEQEEDHQTRLNGIEELGAIGRAIEQNRYEQDQINYQLKNEQINLNPVQYEQEEEEFIPTPAFEKWSAENPWFNNPDPRTSHLRDKAIQIMWDLEDELILSNQQHFLKTPKFFEIVKQRMTPRNNDIPLAERNPTPPSQPAYATSNHAINNYNGAADRMSNNQPVAPTHQIGGQSSGGGQHEVLPNLDMMQQQAALMIPMADRRTGKELRAEQKIEHYKRNLKEHYPDQINRSVNPNWPRYRY